MRRFLVAIGSMTLVAGAMCQEAIQCVNPDVLNALVFEGRPELRMVVKREMPEDGQGYGAPPGFTLIGSGVRGGNVSTIVAYKTEVEASQAFDSLRQFLSSQGWQVEMPTTIQQPMVSVAGPQPLAVQVCRGGERRSLQLREIDGVRFATITGYRTSPPRACNEPVAQRFGFGDPMAAINGLRARLPKISFPDTSRMAAGTGVDQSNLNADAVSTAVRVESPDTAAGLAAFVAAQLVEQGWLRDGGWNGKISTGSSWGRTADDGKTYQGLLEILNLGQQLYNVEFTVSNALR